MEILVQELWPVPAHTARPAGVIHQVLRIEIEFRRLDSTALFDPLGKPLEHVPALLGQSVRIGEAVVG
jgi:hypothetical protein